MKRWNRVQCLHRGYTIPVGTKGRIAVINNRRSHNGYNTLVVWMIKLNKKFRATWIPDTSLKLFNKEK